MTTATKEPCESLQASKILQHSLHAELHDVKVIITDEELILSGDVPSFYLKSLAMESIRPYVGSRKLLNRLTVTK